MPKSGEEAISSSSPGFEHGGTSKGSGEAISSEHTGVPSAAGDLLQKPKAKSAPRQSLTSVITEQRDFDTSESGQKYSSIGPGTLLNFEYECKRTQGGNVCDFGIQRVSQNKPEARFGPSTNPDEGWCNLGSPKLSPANSVTVFNADTDLLTVTFADPRFANWTTRPHKGIDLQDLYYSLVFFVTMDARTKEL